MGVQRRNVPHFKGLINAKVDLGAQGRDTTFTLCHAQLRKPILLLEMAKGVIFIFVNCIPHTFINFWIFSQQYALIPDRTFIKFELMMSELRSRYENEQGWIPQISCFLFL